MSDIYTNPAGNLILEVRDDKLSAWLTIRKTGKLTDERDILDLLEKAGIKAGFDEALRYIREHNLEKDFDEAFPVAICEIVPEEVPLNLHFDAEKARQMTPEQTPETMAELTFIEAGTVLAEYSDNIFDRRGSIFNVFGEMVHTGTSDHGSREAITGDNVSYDAHTGKYTALRGGYPSLEGTGRISVIDTLVVHGSVENHTIKTPADLVIEGDVSGCSITTRGNITIHGNISNSTLFCEGGLTVDGDIRTCPIPGLQVLGDINCSGVVSSYVLCQGRFVFARMVEDSFVVGETGVEGARLLGSTLQTSGDVLLEGIGEPDGQDAILEITISPFYKALLMQLAKEMVHARQSGDPNQIAEVQERSRQCEQELDKQLNAFLHRDGNERCKVTVRGEIYPMLYLRVLKHDYTFKARQSGLEIIERD